MNLTSETAPRITAPARIEPRPFALVRHSLALARRSVVKTLRTPEQLIDVTLQPLIFLLIFVYLLGGAVAGDTTAYLQFILPAMMVQVLMMAGMSTGVNLNTDISKGVFDRFRSLPIGRSAPLIGSVLGDVVRYVVATVSIFGFGYLMGFRVQTGLLQALGAILLVMVFSFSVGWAFVLVGMLARTPGTVQGISFLLVFPLTFGTSMVAPRQTMPGWLQVWLDINPVERVMSSARGLLSGGPVREPVLWTLGWAVALTVVFAPLAVRAYRRRA